MHRSTIQITDEATTEKSLIGVKGVNTFFSLSNILLTGSEHHTAEWACLGPLY